MKNLILLFCFSVVVLFSVESAAQWVQTGPYGGRVNDLAVSGGNIYAAAYGGVLVSTNGIDWTHSNWGLMDGYVNAVVATSSKVFAGTQDHGIYVKDLFGLIWTQTTLDNSRITCLTSIGDYVFAGTSADGVFLTTDHGSTWTIVNNGLTSDQISCFAVSGTNIFCGTGSGIFLSTNNGTSWTSVNTGLPGSTILSLAVNGTDIYAGVRSHGIYYSPNNGQGWLQYGESPTVYPYAIIFHGTGVYTTGNGGGIWRTTNNGTDWTKLNDGTNGMSAYAQVIDIAFIQENLIAAEWHVWESESLGLYATVNYGTDWMQINWGQPKYCGNGIASNNGRIFAATAAGILLSDDDCTTWDNLPTFHTEYEWAEFTTIKFRSISNGFAGDYNGYVYTTTNNGDDWWNPVPPNGNPVLVEDGALITSFEFLSTYIFASTKPFLSGVAGGVYFSSDNGDTWERRSNGLPTLADTNTVVSSLAVSGNNIFAGTGHGVFLSTNNGMNWTQVSNGLIGRNVTSLALKGTELFAGTSTDGVFRTNNNGSNWSHSLPDKNVTALALVDTNIFAGTWAQGMYWMFNPDSTWMYKGLPGVYVTGFAANNGFLFASTSQNTLWKTPIDILTPVEGIENNSPGNFILSQNYPNPFNPSTKIEYNIVDYGLVSLKVFDILGNEVTTLVNEEKPVGRYEITWFGENLPSGVYFYQLRVGELTQTKKMILMK